MMKLDMQSIRSEVMKGDHTFKPAKTLRVDGLNPYKAVYSVMMGEGLIACQYFVEGKSLADTVPIIEKLRNRAAVFPMPPRSRSGIPISAALSRLPFVKSLVSS
jgi:hypothetical protein